MSLRRPLAGSHRSILPIIATGRSKERIDDACVTRSVICVESPMMRRATVSRHSATRSREKEPFHANSWTTYVRNEAMAAIPAVWPAVAMCPVVQKEMQKSRRFR